MVSPSLLHSNHCQIWYHLSFLSDLFLRLFIDGDRMTDPSVREHLQLDSTMEPEFKIQVMPYGSILSELQAVGAGLSPKDKVWLSDKASYALTEAIPKVSGPWKGKCFPLFCSAWSGMVLMRAAELSFLSTKDDSGWSLCGRNPAMLMLRYWGVVNPGVLSLELPFQLTKLIYPKNCQLKIRPVQGEREQGELGSCCPGMEHQPYADQQ